MILQMIVSVKPTTPNNFLLPMR